MRWQQIDIYRDPSEYRALTCGITETAYREPTGARAASMLTIPAGAGGELVEARWQVAVVAKTPDVGIELVSRDHTDQPAQLAEITGFAKPGPGPQRAERVVTKEVRELFEATGYVVPTAPNGWRTIGHRIRADGASAPLVYMSSLILLWAEA